MADDYRLTTPEAIDIAYRVSGIGTRFLAIAIDALIWLGLETVILIGTITLYLQGAAAHSATVILGLSLSFILFWGYFIFFETVWAGQTPGKRRLRIRVIKTSGYPIGFIEAVIRNLVRIIDFLPVFYGVGVLVMFISPQARRLGDYAAGTIVIKERGAVSIADLGVATFRAEIPSVSVPRLGEVDPDELAWNLQALSTQDRQIIQEFLDRAPSLASAARQRLGEGIAARTAQRIGAREPLDPVRFLERVIYLQSTDH
jgi:uncharacterized RDD family membrane protein YckC